jgi:hypothetical protein
MNSLIRKLVVASAISAAAFGAYADGGGPSPEDLHQFMVSAGMNKDGMVSKKGMMKKVEAAMKAADPKGKGMFDEAMMRKFFSELYSGGSH